MVLFLMSVAQLEAQVEETLDRLSQVMILPST
jgi:hypothetical protein